MNNPQLIATPFAENGDKNIIPESIPLEPQNATLEKGFPPITQQKISEGGIPPERLDFNGALNLITQHTVFLNKGGRYGFNAEFANKIGGYEKGACLTLNDGTQVVSNIDANTNDPNVNMTGWIFPPIKVNASSVLDESGLTQQEWNSGVAKQSDLLQLTNAKDGNRVFVKSIQQWFTYTPNTQEVDNGVTVVSKWVMDIPEKYLASWFAKPNIKEPQGISLQNGYAYATSKKRPYIIDDLFWVSGIEHNAGTPNSDRASMLAISNSELTFLVGYGVLRVIPNNYTNYNVITIANGVEDIVINNPFLVGDRKDHDYSSGGTHEWGYGLVIHESKNITVNQPTSMEMTGDGIYIGKPWGSMIDSVPTDITINDPVVRKVRRNGISFTAGDNVNINNPVICDVRNVDGIDTTAPACAIDIEPEEMEGAKDAYIINSTVHNLKSVDCLRGITIAAFNDNRKLFLDFTGITTIDSTNLPSKMVMTVYNQTKSGLNNQRGIINISHLNFINRNNITQECIMDSAKADTGFIVSIDKFTIDGARDFLLHNITTNEHSIQYGGIVFKDILFISGGKHKFKMGFYYLSETMRDTAKPNYHIHFNKISIPDLDTSYDYNNGKLVGGSYYCNAIANVSGAVTSLAVHSNNIVFDTVGGVDCAYGYVDDDYREVNISLRDKVGKAIEINGWGADSSYLASDGTMVQNGASVKLFGNNSFVKMKRVSKTETIRLDYCGKLVAW